MLHLWRPRGCSWRTLGGEDLWFKLALAKLHARLVNFIRPDFARELFAQFRLSATRERLNFITRGFQILSSILLVSHATTWLIAVLTCNVVMHVPVIKIIARVGLLYRSLLTPLPSSSPNFRVAFN